MYNKSRIIIFFLCVAIYSEPYAAGFQSFPTLAYNNPAELNLVHKSRAIVGGTDFMTRLRYTGWVNSDYGTTLSSTNTIYPYLELASRINPKLVLSFDVSHPLFSNISYPENSLLDAVGTEGIIYDTNYSPKLSYQVSEFVAVGLGVDLNHISNIELNFDSDALRPAYNKAQGWGYGWDAGISFQMDKITVFNFSYYSKIFFKALYGTSSYNSVVREDFMTNLILPDTFSFNMTHKISPKWSVYETARYVLWSEQKYIDMKNTVTGTYVIHLNYIDIWSLKFGFLNKVTDDFIFGGSLIYDANPQSITYRPATLPATSSISGVLSFEYFLTHQLSTKFQYSYTYANPKIAQDMPFQSGRSILGANTLDLGLTLAM